MTMQGKGCGYGCNGGCPECLARKDAHASMVVCPDCQIPVAVDAYPAHFHDHRRPMQAALSPDQQAEVRDRLAVCWDACADLPTEALRCGALADALRGAADRAKSEIGFCGEDDRRRTAAARFYRALRELKVLR
jgi:hypothetical protein